MNLSSLRNDVTLSCALPSSLASSANNLVNFSIRKTTIVSAISLHQLNYTIEFGSNEYVAGTV